MAEHEELRKGEVYIGNYTDDGFAELGWKTKRMGVVAYNRDDQEVSADSGLHPVFVQRSELIKAGIDPDRKENR